MIIENKRKNKPDQTSYWRYLTSIEFKQFLIIFLWHNTSVHSSRSSKDWSGVFIFNRLSQILFPLIFWFGKYRWLMRLRIKNLKTLVKLRHSSLSRPEEQIADMYCHFYAHLIDITKFSSITYLCSLGL